MGGRLTGVGVGPGDPDLITVKGLKALRDSDVVFVPVDAEGHPGYAEGVVLAHVDPARVQRVVFALGGDQGTREESWRNAAAVVAEVVRGGGWASFATIGDPNLYSTFTYVAHTVRGLVAGVEVRTVPGITAMQDLAARSGTVLAEGSEPLTLFPYTAGDAPLRGALDRGDTVVVYKGGRHLPDVLDAVRDAGRLDDSVYGEQLGLAGEEIARADQRTGSGPYMSTVIVPARRNGGRGEKL